MKKDQIYLSDYVFPVSKFGKMGKIHSVFDRSFNIEVNHHLINIASYREYLSSYGLFIPEVQFKELQPFIQKENVVKVSETGLVIYSPNGVKNLELSNAEVVSLTVLPIQMNQSEVDLLIHVLEKKNLKPQLGLAVGEKEEALFNELATGLTVERWPEILTYLIGRGKGLTPSGDDLLLAYLFVMKLFKPELAKSLSDILKQRRLSTTVISKNYIEALLADSVSSPIYRLFTAVKKNESKESLAAAVDQLAMIGHTSGKDMSFGVLLGLYAVKEMNNL